MKTHFVFTVGGVLSGLGKGISTASMGLLLKQRGFSVTAVKIDPYISIDAGTMRPAEHGETFVTADGGELDQDLGNYERYLEVDLEKANNITTGKVFQSVIENERSFVYAGRDAEMFPDVIDEIKRRIYERARGYDFCMVEVGGTTGDLENLPFLHAGREIGRERDAAYVMVTYLPFLRNVGELKTKPTQHAVTALRSVGIAPDLIITRNEVPIDQPRRETIAKRCFVDEECIIDNPDIDNVYDMPLMFEREKVADLIMKKFGLRARKADLTVWKKMVNGMKKPKKKIRVGMVGKYFKHGDHNHKDVYVSVFEALRHASGKLAIGVEVVAVDSSELERSSDPNAYLDDLKLDGMIVPQGWGKRGVEGILLGVRYARERRLPYLGLCFGMQMAVIEFARNVAGMKKANSSEVDAKTKFPVVHIMPEQEEYLRKKQYGGTIRLGDWPCKLAEGSLVKKVYEKYEWMPKTGVLQERHRHRYELNNVFKKELVEAGLVISGLSPDGKLVEMIELPRDIHPFFVGTQFHPEYKSRPLSPHPLFLEFVSTCA